MLLINKYNNKAIINSLRWWLSYKIRYYQSRTTTNSNIGCDIDSYPGSKGSNIKYLDNGGYQSFQMSELLDNAVPRNQNSPLNPPYGLYPELLTGTAFTAPRYNNYYTWLYRKYPTITQLTRIISNDEEEGHHKVDTNSSTIYNMYNGNNNFILENKDDNNNINDGCCCGVTPEPYRFISMDEHNNNTAAAAAAEVDWIDSLFTIAYHNGAACGIYDFNINMSDNNRVFIHHDADIMLLPREGILNIRTELGILRAGPREMVLIPKGIKFTVDGGDINNNNNPEKYPIRAKGYFLENFGAPFKIPDLGPIGISGGLAHPRHFRAPTASIINDDNNNTITSYQLISKFQGLLYKSLLSRTPYDVIGWYGNYYPVLYDLGLFMAINSVTYDHPDPSIGVVLQSQSLTYSPGTANVDFVIFPPRWLPTENTFRPPWFHRNVMSEFMGLLYGGYDAKKGFKPGYSSIHNKLAPHGPDRDTATTTTTRGGGGGIDNNSDGGGGGRADRYSGTMAFMWESDNIWIPTKNALNILKDDTYINCWIDNPKQWNRFDINNKPTNPNRLAFNPNNINQ